MKKLLLLVVVLFFPLLSLAQNELPFDMSYEIKGKNLTINLKESTDSRANINTDIISMSIDLHLSSNVMYIGRKGINAIDGLNIKSEKNKVSILSIGLEDIDIFKDGVDLKFRVISDGDINILASGTYLPFGSTETGRISFEPNKIFIDGLEKTDDVEIPETTIQEQSQDQQSIVTKEPARKHFLPSSGPSTYILLAISIIIIGFFSYEKYFKN